MKCPRCQYENETGSLFCSRCGTQLGSGEPASSVSRTLTLQTRAEALTVGETFAGRFQVVEELGKGGMGRVYKAYDTEIKEHVALKVLNPEIAGDETVVERFRRELKFARAISHRNVCRMFDLGRAGDTAYIAMEFVSGEDLKTLLRRVGHLPPNRTVAVARQIADGLAEAHRLGVIHRDLKSSNVMIDREGNARIMDFGIARAARGRGITDAGVIIGTPDYMSPEQLEGKEADRRSDIYSLGAVLFEMVAGEPPFEGETPLIVAARHKTEPPRDPADVNPQTPAALSRLILRCLEKDPGRRFQTAEELGAALEAIEKDLPSTRGITRPLPRMAGLSGWKRVAPFVLVAVVAAVASIIVLGRKGTKVGPSTEGMPVAAAYKNSLAVLPFQDLSPQRDQEAFSNGITDDLITRLSSLGQLKVISRQSVMRYKSTEKDIREIGKELGVETILEGSIQREKDNLRVNVKLTRAQDGSSLWSETYDRKVESIFTVQDEISRAVVNALRIELVAGQDYMLVKRYTQDPDAYDLYLQGRLEWSKRTEAALRRSIELYQEAISKDPNFALAYAGIADSHIKMARLDLVPPKLAYPKAREAAEKALQLDDALAEGYVAMASVKSNSDWDWMGAEIDFNWAIGLNPNYATAYHYYGSMLETLGRFEEALANFEKAQELDPNSLPFMLSIANHYYHSRRPDPMVRQAREILKLDTASSREHFFLGLAYQLKGSFKKALGEFERAEKMDGGRGAYLADIAYLLALSGNRPEAEKAFQELIKRSEQKYVPSYSLAQVSVALGEREKAFEYLEKALADKETGLMAFRFDPRLDPLRDDPRFDALLERMNLR